VSVPNGSSRTLVPGKYRDVILEPHSTLTLTGGGIYHIRDLWVKTGANLLAAGTSDLRVLGGFALDNGSVIGPAEGSPSVTARSIVVYVGTDDAHSRFSTAVNVSPKAVVRANFFAPNGTVFLNQETQATGAFVGRRVVLGRLAKVTLHSAFDGVLPLFTGRYKAGAPGTENGLREIPSAFVLEQNFPNPFNPSTLIRFGMPDDGHVSVTVHNMLGQLVAVLDDGFRLAGYHEVRWDGRTGNGTPVGSGMYLCRVQAGERIQTRKMLLVK
jgi:hypothetical protein